MTAIPSSPLQRFLASQPGSFLADRLFVQRRRTRFLADIAHPHSRQQAIFAQLVQCGQATRFGREHDFARLRTVADYQAAVPVRGYPNLRPWIDAMLYDREPDVLWPGQVDWFAESSGTSGAKKQIPVTRDGLRTVYQATAIQYVALLLARLDQRRFLAGKTIFFVGSVRQAEHNPRVLLADITGLNVHLFPNWLEFTRTPGKEISLLPDWEARLYGMAEATLRENVVHLAGLPTWIRHFGRIVRETTGVATLREIWPNLIATTCGGVNPAPYLPEINRLILGDAAGDASLLHSETYNGTEGFYAAQFDAGPMALLPNAGIFYEFVPRREAEEGNFRGAVPLAGVEKGGDYAPIITTGNGLWRYLIGDTVRFVSTAPYRVEVSGRISQFLSLTGEELLVHTTDAVLGKVCADWRVGLVDYTATGLRLVDAPEYACHLWLVELAEDTPDPAAFAAALDRTLIASHYDYAKARSRGTESAAGFGLAAPLVLFLPAGSFQRWLADRLGGRVGGQSKVPRLSHSPATAQALLFSLPADVRAGIFSSVPASLSPSLHLALDHFGEAPGQR
ncbi:MAG: GH3 auxin-responsive promoter family protein [Caldilineaceae bacterium]|nr:GH3 auxin-responsive promoter family protein [Caldilineaceae bacterium]